MSNLHTETISYDAEGTTLKGYLAYDASHERRRPGVLVIHEWWGLNDYIRRRTDKLAELGYCAFAVDMFGDGKRAKDPTEAGAMMNAVLEDMQTGTARLRAAYQTLAGHRRVDGTKLAAIGYCFGGAMALHMARIGMDLKAAVSFHGSLGSFHKPARGSVLARVLVCHGGADELISKQEVEAFKQEMEAAGADYRFIVHEGARHGFTSPEADENGAKYGLPLAYDATADRESWEEMQRLFAAVL